jgi:plasmid maintenance system antidote protein VapI
MKKSWSPGKLRGKIIEKCGAQYKFARRLNIVETDISAVIHGRKVLDGPTKSKWAKALGCEVEEIFGDAA